MTITGESLKIFYFECQYFKMWQLEMKLDDFDCRNEILNHLQNLLYSVFVKYKAVNEL